VYVTVVILLNNPTGARSLCLYLTFFCALCYRFLHRELENAFKNFGDGDTTTPFTRVGIGLDQEKSKFSDTTPTVI